MADDQKVRDAQLKQSIQQKLIESGEYERLKEILRQKLIDSGWRDELKEHTMSAPPPPPQNFAAAAQFFRRAHRSRSRALRRAAALIRSKGDQQLTVEELTSEIQPHGRATVPDEVKADLLQRIRRFVEEQGA
jgi:enhancer of yellow 2 transcription factor